MRVLVIIRLSESFSSPLPSPPYASDCGQEGKAKIHSPKTPQAGNSAKEIPPEAGKLKTDPAEPTLPTGNELEKTEASDKSPSQNQEDLGDKVKLPTAEKDELQESPNLSEEATPVADVQPEDQLDIPSNTSDPNSQAETPKTSIKRELKKTQPKKLIAQTAGKLLDPSLAEQSPQGESRRSGRPPRASFKSRMDNAATSHQQEKPKSESTRGRRAQKSKKRKSDHDVYEFHSSDSEDEGLIPTVVSKFANFNENCSNSSTTTGCVTTTTAKVVSSTTLTPAVQPKKNGQESLSIVPIMKPTEDKKSCKEEEKFPPPKTAFEIAISESFESSRSFVGSTGRGRGKHLRFLKPKRKMAEDLSGKMEEIDSAVPQIIDSPKSEIQADKVEEIKPEDPIMVIKNEELESCAVETTNSVEPVESDPLDTAALSPSISEAQKDDAEVAAISSNSVAIGDRSDSDTPSSSQSDASLKVPPLRIVFPTTSRSNSAVSEADVVSHSVTVGVSSVAHRGERLPYVVKLKEDGSGGQVEGIEDGRSLDTSEASDDESGSAAHTNDGTQSESDLSRSTQDVHAGLGVNRKNAGGHTKRVTRSQARRGGHAESRTKETTTAVTSEASDGLQSANDLESAHHVHPRKRKYHRKEIHAVVSSETSSTNPTWTLTSSVATTSEAVRSDPPETHPSTSTLSANDLTSVSCYEGFRELRMRVSFFCFLIYHLVTLLIMPFFNRWSPNGSCKLSQSHTKDHQISTSSG